jgi:uncharacterized protein (TIGR00369 family)
MGDAIFRPKSCFVCGTDNPAGLDLAPERDGEKVFVRFVPGSTHLGYSKAVHGGITASLLDEVVGIACGLSANAKCATVELTVTYRRPILEGTEVRAEGWFVEQKGKLIFGEGRVVDGEGRVCATARGRFVTLDAALLGRFVGTDGE